MKSVTKMAAQKRKTTRRPRLARERANAYTTKEPRLTRAEAQALAEFRARLKEILPEGALRSLILYGSKARGDAHRGSDVDLLVVYDASRGEKKEMIQDTVGEIELNTFENRGTLLEMQPFVLNDAELRQGAHLGMPLLHNIAREGIVLEGVPIMPEEMDRKYWAELHIADAKRQLRSARLLLADGDIRSAISMAYFVYLDAARAALIAKGIAPQSHAGTNRLFGLHFIKTGLLAKKFGPHFGRLETDRLEATYTKKKQFAKEDAERALAIAGELIVQVEGLLLTLLAERK